MEKNKNNEVKQKRTSALWFILLFIIIIPIGYIFISPAIYISQLPDGVVSSYEGLYSGSGYNHKIAVNDDNRHIYTIKNNPNIFHPGPIWMEDTSGNKIYSTGKQLIEDRAGKRFMADIIYKNDDIAYYCYNDYYKNMYYVCDKNGDVLLQSAASDIQIDRLILRDNENIVVAVFIKKYDDFLIYTYGKDDILPNEAAILIGAIVRCNNEEYVTTTPGTV